MQRTLSLGSQSLRLIRACAVVVAVAGLLSGVALRAANPAAAMALPPLSAKWIWSPESDVHAYNQTIFAQRQFKLKQPGPAVLRITADCFYRVSVNGQWVNDGPARCYPEHYQYDQLDVSTYLKEGANEIEVIARYYGVGDFHRLPQQAGLLAQLDVQGADGRITSIVTDAVWKTAVAKAWRVNTPKVSIQMEPAEWYDARLAGGEKFVNAKVLFAADQGPWKDLQPRDSALLSRQPFAPKAFLGAQIVRNDALNFCLPAVRLVNPGITEANHSASGACGMATVLELDREQTVVVQNEGFKVAIDGQRREDGRFQLTPGRHLVLAFVRDVCSHDKEKSLRFAGATPPRLQNPLSVGHENPWCFLRFPEYAFATNDLRWIEFRGEDPRIASIISRYTTEHDTLLTTVSNTTTFEQKLKLWAELMASETMFVQDSAWQFMGRQVVRDGTQQVQSPAALMHDNAEVTVVQPARDGEVELLYDLGEQNCGYYDLDLTAPAGVTVDIFGVEYIAPDGRIQHSYGNRNGMRFITREGANRFTSLKRRSGRYLFLTLRNQSAPVAIRKFQLIESTYPVAYTGSFACSDTRLDKIWEISARTLKLCMEDSFTDCPLYEQTHWVGDARNESLLAYPVFGAADLARRCIKLTAQSLDHYPIAGCQVPSGWDCILPAWSFLWGISTWDHYWYTGDREFLRQIYPAVIRNLKGSEQYVNDQGLFSASFWNLFDWSGIDQGQKTVLHNSMFLVGAIDAALKEADVLQDNTHVAWLQGLRARVIAGVNKLYNPEKQAYPDSIRGDGSISPSTCQHTCFLSLLYEIAEEKNRAPLKAHLTNPPEKMVRIGSPFAMLYLYEALEKLGMEDEIVRQTYQNYLPMVESGATTVWESFPTGTTGSGGFPTRSHCHAWSSAPVYFLNRSILGVKATAPAGAAFTLSPRLNGLTWARGTVATIKGPVNVSWKRTDNRLEVQYSAPADTQVAFQRNDTLQGLDVVVNGKKAE